jgi:hypothetical protein
MTTRCLCIPFLAVVFVLIVVTNALSQNTTVRGELIYGPQTPAQYLKVTLYNQALGRSAPVTSGPDGMYYFYNVPYGNYTLEVWLPNNPKGYNVQVNQPQICDIPQILLN